MFKDNKYTTIYWKIIARAQLRETVQDGERHHIIPKSLGGSDLAQNLTVLSMREHYLVHLLLTKMTQGTARRSMAFALSFFNTQCRTQSRPRPSSRWYEYSRRLLREVRAGQAPSAQCQAASRASRKGQAISAHQKQKISAALRKRTAFFAVDPDNRPWSGPDLREFCAQHGLSWNTMIKRLDSSPRVITAGRNRGWIYSSCPVPLEDADSIRSQAIVDARERRSRSVRAQWTSARRAAVGKVPSQVTVLRDPDGVVHEFSSLGAVREFGPVSTIQLSTVGQEFSTGAWAGWRRLK